MRVRKAAGVGEKGMPNAKRHLLQRRFSPVSSSLYRDVQCMRFSTADDDDDDGDGQMGKIEPTDGRSPPPIVGIVFQFVFQGGISPQASFAVVLGVTVAAVAAVLVSPCVAAICR